MRLQEQGNFIADKSGVYCCIGRARFDKTFTRNAVQVRRGATIMGEFYAEAKKVTGKWLVYAEAGETITFTTVDGFKKLRWLVTWIAETPQDVDYATLKTQNPPLSK